MTKTKKIDLVLQKTICRLSGAKTVERTCAARRTNRVVLPLPRSGPPGTPPRGGGDPPPLDPDAASPATSFTAHAGALTVCQSRVEPSQRSRACACRIFPPMLLMSKKQAAPPRRLSRPPPAADLVHPLVLPPFGPPASWSFYFLGPAVSRGAV